MNRKSSDTSRIEPLLENLITLLALPGIGCRRLSELLAESPFLVQEPITRNFWLYVQKNLRRSVSRPEQSRIMSATKKTMSGLQREDFGIVTIFDPHYPPLLKEIYDPPLALFFRGNASLLQSPCLAVIGARRASDYGVAVAGELASRLAKSGMTIVAGLARGIDAAAHYGSLKSRGATIAVLGSGVDVIYPKEARELYGQICREGCIVSEFLPGSRPTPQHFPVRNRIISGLCLGTVIVEATQRSGSLITARLTTEHNRELFAVPGPVHSPLSVGTNYLIKQGAKLVQIWTDIFEELPRYIQDQLLRPIATGLEEKPFPAESENSVPEFPSLSNEQASVLDLISPENKVSMDYLLEHSGLSLGQVSRILLELQLRDLIAELPGQYFIGIIQ